MVIKSVLPNLLNVAQIMNIFGGNETQNIKNSSNVIWLNSALKQESNLEKTIFEGLINFLNP